MTRNEYRLLIYEARKAELIVSDAYDGEGDIDQALGLRHRADDALLAVYDALTAAVAEAQARITVLEAALNRATEGLRAPTHEANDFNCEDWPPGHGCSGCDGDELRADINREIQALLGGAVSHQVGPVSRSVLGDG